jgi:hypothetical protein
MKRQNVFFAMISKAPGRKHFFIFHFSFFIKTSLAVATLLILSQIVSAQKPFAIVELFTSEGCSSCPPADNLLSSIKEQAEKSHENIITLAYHVDYWNKLGWKDPYGKYQYTVRQENYSRVLAEKEMFTPEAVVNGKLSCIGSRREELDANIKKGLSGVPKISVTIKKDSVIRDSVFLSYTISAQDADFVLRIALTEDGLSSNVTAGENNGKVLKHDSVVRLFNSVDKPGNSGNVIMPYNVFPGKGKRHIVAFVQRKKSMEIVGIDRID